MRKRPNVIYFVCHDLGRALGCYGAGVPTPNLDTFAEESIQFQSAHCASPACSPSRACAMSGLYPWKNGTLGLSHMGWPMPEEIQTSVDDFNHAGYTTILSGINHERHPRTDRYQDDLSKQWEDWFSDRAVTNALDAIDSRDATKPFYLNIATSEPHICTWQEVGVRIPALPEEDRKAWVPEGMPRTPTIERTFRDQFAASIAFMDAQFGRLIEGLRGRDLIEDTLVVFTTDHGMSGPRGKGSLYGLGTEVALLMRLPGGHHGGEERSQLTTNLDFRYTLAEAAGIKTDPDQDGRSFWKVIENPAAKGRTSLYLSRNFHGQKPFRIEESYQDTYNPMRALRTEEFLYIRNYAPFAHPAEITPESCVPLDSDEVLTSFELPEGPQVPEELYDLKRDPHEICNRIHDPDLRGILKSLRKTMDETIREACDFLPAQPPARPCSPGWGGNWPWHSG